MDDAEDSVFAQVTLTAAPHAKNCEVLRFSEEKLWTCGVDGRLACSSFEGGRMFGMFGMSGMFGILDDIGMILG